MFKPYGIIAAMLTPFHDDESVNLIELRKQVNRFINAGVHGLFCLGTNGEFYSLSYEEKLDVIETTVDECRGRIPVYAGTGCITTKETITLTKAAQDIGVDCVSIITPYFAACSQEDIYRHYLNVALSADIPIILYNIPARTGNHISWQTAEKLSRIKNIAGIKDSSGDFNNILDYINKTENLAVLSGNDSLILNTLQAGGTGAISGIANILPEKMVEIYNLWIEKDIERARAVQDSIKVIRSCLKLGNPNSVVKRATYLKGNTVGPAREPFNISDETLDDKIKEALRYYE